MIYSTLTTFRNTCAHGGRLFCKRAGKRGDKTFGDMLVDLATVSTPFEIAFAIDTLKRDLDTLNDIVGLRGLVESEMGLNKPEIEKFFETNGIKR